MKIGRTIIETAACAVTVGVLVVPNASAGPLLSGYGGPGQGSQAILGSVLLNGPGAGGGSSSSAGAVAARQSSAGSLAVPQSASSTPPRAPVHRSRHATLAGRSPRHNAAGGPTRSPLPITPAYARAERTGAGSGTLGLSTADFLYAVLVLAGLALAGVVTRRLSRATPAKGPG
jgi:hypothetical protein